MTKNLATKSASVKILSEEPCKISAVFEIEPKRVEEEIEKIFSEIQKDAQLPGFRQGKVPMEIIKKEFARTAEEKALNRLAAESIYEYAQTAQIRVASAPAVRDVSFKEKDGAKGLVFTATIERHPEVPPIKNYKKIKINRKKVSVEDAEIKERIDLLRQRNSTLAPDLSLEVKAGESFAVIDYDLLIDGEILKGASAQNYLVDVSNPANIKGLNEALAGMKAGQSKEIEITFPNDYPNPNLRSKTGKLRFTLKDVKKKILPEADDNFAKDIGFETFKALEDAVKLSIQKEKEDADRDETRHQIEEALLKNNTFDVPQSIVEDYAASLLESVKNYLLRSGAIPSESEWEKRKAEFQARSLEDARSGLRLEYIYGKIAEMEKIQFPTDEELKSTRETFKKNWRGAEADFDKKWEEDKENIKHSLFKEKIFKFLTDEAVIKEI